MGEKIQNSFYLLKEELLTYSNKTGKLTKELINFEFLGKNLKSKDYREQKIISNLSEKYDLKLYYKKTKTNPQWKGFLQAIAEPDEDVLKLNRSFSESYVIVLQNKSSKKYFVTTGGYGHTSVQEISVNDFGLEVLSRLIKAEDKTLRSTKERSITGGIQGEIKFFRNDYNIYENEKFGNVYNELVATIDKKQLRKIFGFSKQDILSNSFCLAKNSFSLKKAISFPELLVIIEKCEDLLLKPQTVEINSIEKISKSSKYLINKLYDELFSKIYENYKEENNFISVEISHKEFDKYYYSNKVIVETTIKRKRKEFVFEESIKNIQILLNEIKSVETDLSDCDFKKILETAYLKSYDENGVILTEDSLKNHFCTEMSMDSKSYFLIEKDWYKMKERFLTQINEQALYFSTNNRYLGDKLKNWDESVFSSENEYNASYLNESETLVFDRFTPQNIEACDFMKWDDKSVYFYHVKKGFDNSMRDLCNQVFISARRIQEDLKTEKSFLKLLYNTVINNNGEGDYSKECKKQFDNISENDFLGIFNQREIIFVLAFLDVSKIDRKITQDISAFKSTIAKFSLVDLSKKMRNLDVKFQIEQLEKQ